MADAPPPPIAAEALAALFTNRRAGLGTAVRVAQRKAGAVVAQAHLDELDLIHDALADLGLLSPRERDPDAFDPYDPTDHLPDPRPRRTAP